MQILLNILSDITYLLVYWLVGYRRSVTRTNLENSFPEKTAAERRKIERRYYRHMCDLLLEGLHNLAASKSSIKKRYHFSNPELVDCYYDQGKSVILMSAHYNNWEYMVSSIDFQLKHHGVGVGKPLSQKGIAKFVDQRRTRYGCEVVSKHNVREVVDYYENHHVPTAYMMLSDQAHSNPQKCYWTRFLNQDTGFLYGAEYFARKYEIPVLYYSVKKVRRGHYVVTFERICEHPSEAKQYDITEQYVRRLEHDINAEPEYWLWSHRRWKKKRPTNTTIMH